MANIGHPQIRNGKYTEQALVTSGNDLAGITRFLTPGSSTYTAADVVTKLMVGTTIRTRPDENPSRLAVESVVSA